jgi:hypothetical protein
MDESEAMSWLLQEYRGDNAFTEESARELWNDYKQKVAALGTRSCTKPTCSDGRTENERYEEGCLLKKFAKDSRILRVVKIDDPGKLIIHQLSVVVPQTDKYLEKMKDPRKRVRACLGRGMDFDGVHPKARREGECLTKPVPHFEFEVTSCNGADFELRELDRHIAVKEHDERMMLSAGYHRAHISIYRSNPEDTVLPFFAVVESDADGFFSVGSKVPFKRDLVLGCCPPLLEDFFDEDLCIVLPTRKCRVEISVNTITRQWNRSWIECE